MDETRISWSQRAVAITGASGFVGQHLALRLAEEGAHVTALLRPTSERRRLLAAGVRCLDYYLDDIVSIAHGCAGCEMLFHLAGAVDFAGDWPRFRRVNVDGTRNVIAAARQAGVRRLIHTSSIVAVGATPAPTIQDEDSPWDLGTLRIPYVTTKREAEERALLAKDLDVVVVNPACVIGPDDFGGSEFGVLCRRFWKGQVPFYFGGGNNFVDVRDVADGMLRAARHGRPGQRYILGGTNLTFHAFFAELARSARRSIFRLRLPAALAEPLARLGETLSRAGSRPTISAPQARLLSWYFFFDTSKARQELGYRPRLLRDTLADAHRFWMRKRSA